MIDAELLEILVCPETKQPVRVADSALLDRLNRAVSAGTLKNRGGDVVGDSLDGGLVREDGRILYPVRDDIPIMLLDEAIEVEGPSDGGAGHEDETS
jgi:uncharacterized protein YbaR (Trm112 family)